MQFYQSFHFSYEYHLICTWPEHICTNVWCCTHDPFCVCLVRTCKRNCGVCWWQEQDLGRTSTLTHFRSATHSTVTTNGFKSILFFREDTGIKALSCKGNGTRAQGTQTQTCTFYYLLYYVQLCRSTYSYFSPFAAMHNLSAPYLFCPLMHRATEGSLLSRCFR